MIGMNTSLLIPSALKILDWMRAMDDSDPMVYYLFAWAYFTRGEADKKNENWDDARDALRIIIDVDGNGLEEEVFEHVKELYAIVDGYLISIGWMYDDDGAVHSEGEDEAMDEE
jgi:hypothetical protein